MSQTVYLNQFNQTPIKGNSATKVNLNTLPVTIDPNSTNTLIPGDAVYLTTTTANQIYVDKCTVGIQPFGYILYNLKTDQFIANSRVEIGLAGTIMFAEAGATITRGQALEYQPNAIATGPLMLPSAGINPVSAVALDNASSNGSIFRMMILWQPETPDQAVFSFAAAIGNNSINPLNGETQLVSLTLAGTATFNAASVIPNKRLYFVITSGSATSNASITFSTNFRASATLPAAGISGNKVTITFVGDGTNYVELARATGPAMNDGVGAANQGF